MRTSSQRRAAVLGVFLCFFFALLAINFSHTETNLETSKSCPACHFQTSSLSVSPAPPVQLPPLFLISILSYQDSPMETPAVSNDRLSRSPPLS